QAGSAAEDVRPAVGRGEVVRDRGAVRVVGEDADQAGVIGDDGAGGIDHGHGHRHGGAGDGGGRGGEDEADGAVAGVAHRGAVVHRDVDITGAGGGDGVH